MRYETLRARTLQQFPRLRIVNRQRSMLLRVLFWPLTVCGVDYSNFATTLGSTIYVPAAWGTWTDLERYQLLRHEKVHVAQFNLWPIPVRWLWPLNYVLMSLCYLFAFPVLLTTRAYFERQAYTQTMLAHHEDGSWSLHNWDAFAEWLARTFSNSSYLWMSRYAPTYEWARTVQRKILLGDLVSDPNDVVPLEEDDDRN